MEMNIKKLWPLVGAMCVSFTSAAFADSYSTQGNDTMQQGNQGSYQRGTYREITPPAGPRVAHGADVGITADFIWWKATQEGGYAVASSKTETKDDVTTVTEHKKNYSEKWAPGFKAGLGLNLGHDGWDVLGQYTWLNAKNTHTVDQSNNRWELHFNVIDLELGRNFYVSQYLTLRPFMGLKGTWQKHEAVEFTKQDKDTKDLSHYNIDQFGIGIRGGFNTSWYLTKSFSIYGNMAFANMWSDYDKNFEKDYTKNTVVEANDNYTIKHLLELELGLRWETWFYDDSYHLAIQAGWEQQVWSNWVRLAASTAAEDLNLHGLTLKFRFDF